MAKRFFYVCLGILALVAAHSIGAKDSEAQSGAPVFVGITTEGLALTAITSNGDVYAIGDGCSRLNVPPYIGWYSQNGGGYDHPQWVYMGNVIGGAVPSQPNSLGGVKSLFR